jgi:hypothetical protein
MLVASMAGPGVGSVKEWGPDPIAALRSAAAGWIPLLPLSGPAGQVAAALGAVAPLLPHVLPIAAPLEGTAAAGAGLGGADIATGLAARGWRVVRFEFSSMASQRLIGRRQGPDRLPLLQEAFRQQVRLER